MFAQSESRIAFKLQKAGDFLFLASYAFESTKLSFRPCLFCFYVCWLLGLSHKTWPGMGFHLRVRVLKDEPPECYTG